MLSLSLFCMLQSMTLQEPVFIHPSSVLYHMNKEFIVYQSVEETSSRIYMKGITFCHLLEDIFSTTLNFTFQCTFCLIGLFCDSWEV